MSTELAEPRVTQTVSSVEPSVTMTTGIKWMTFRAKVLDLNPSAASATYASLRKARGVMPVQRRKALTNADASENPTRYAVSLTEAFFAPR